jgi:hypothetical protein
VFNVTGGHRRHSFAKKDATNLFELKTFSGYFAERT